MFRVRIDVMEAIQQQYSHYPKLSSLYTTILKTSITFIVHIISWVDAKHDILFERRKTSSDVWVLITKVICDFFKERISPHR